MLPAPADTDRRLAAVLPSAIASLTGEPTASGPSFALPRARSAAVLLVDGLGTANLAARRGHARYLTAVLGKRDAVRTVFPSTTAAAIATFATGADPGRHGLVGYRTLVPERDILANQLNGWEAGLIQPDWQRRPTLFETSAEYGVTSFAVGAPRYADSGFTRAVLRGAEYRAGASIEDRFAIARELLDEVDGALVYLYVPELDQLAHAEGWESDRWLAALERLDAAVMGLGERMPRGAGMLVTADHGVVDIPASRHVFVDRDPGLVDGVRHVGGEPRNVALYFEPGLDASDREALVARWRDAEGDRAWIITRDEVIDAGLFGVVDDDVRPRIGDLLVAARAGVAYYDSREENRQAERMIGQHGSLSDEESRVPLARFGAYAKP
ncbi:alkaline phosphatase family protein [Agromyces protaetiae]|uniref:Alkaline phosphatase family protein n=2 Tax=Agromyces protaetiae TaxID=2509455 RepID=A0A4P6FIK8_9MICO|nr:alkaline phosphatase family protein [Agromyces protaetiae]